MREVILFRCNCGRTRSGSEEVTLCHDCGGYVTSDTVAPGETKPSVRIRPATLDEEHTRLHILDLEQRLVEAQNKLATYEGRTCHACERCGATICGRD